MHGHVTLLHPDERSASRRGLSWALPPDLLEQVRGRVRVIALLMMFGFALDPIFFFGRWAIAALHHQAPPGEVVRDAAFYLADLTVVVASAGLWWIARSSRVSATRLHTLGLLYEVAICFVLALRTYWEYYRDTGIFPNLTWVPAVIILFPLILPAPPRVMLAAAAAAAATPPFALWLLGRWGQVPADAAAMFNATMGSAIAVGFAYLGSRVVYGLGREVAAARELGSYRLEEKLGEGGMGEVWRARHRMLARPAAIKLIRPALAGDARAGGSDEMLRRFEREAQAIAGLRSPHTVTLFDFGTAEDGAFYYAMELLEGLDADTLVRRFGPMPPERAVHLLGQVCHSLSEADSRGLVHRDIKPANIFVGRYGEDYDFVKVLDFGLVKALGDTAAEPALTRETFVQGTPAFIAPEQALGGSELDGRVDIYATGCVAYWLLTGQLVFTADTPMGLVLHHAHTPASPPSSRVDAPISPALDHLVLSCLAKDPAKRPQSAKELARRLAEVGAGEWSARQATAWWTSHHPLSG
jgi:eukaryotic-like serine/threonine-protein kinase